MDHETSMFLCGDVMTGRGIDQILPHPSDPMLYEPNVGSALEYVALAEQANGPIPHPVGFPYVWGDALAEIEARLPDVRIINLETAVTTSERAAPKGINYRMHPENVGCLRAAGIGCCVLANNHVLDWGVPGLLETLDTLRGAGIATAGAGATADEAESPAILEVPGGRRVLVFAFGCLTSGIPANWSAAGGLPGVSLLADLSPRTAERVAERTDHQRRPGDVVVASVHWGSNWGYTIDPDQQAFARFLIDSGSVDVVYGHSSHHVKGIEIYAGKLILYGCGDFIDDYEGIGGFDEFRPELAVAYFVTVEPSSGRAARVEMVPFRRRRMRLEIAASADLDWLQLLMNREGGPLGTRVRRIGDRSLELSW